MVPVWRDAHHEVGGFIEGAAKFGFDLVPIGMAWATPSGPVTDEFFEHFCDTLVTGVRIAKPDGVLIALHGAMVTPKYSVGGHRGAAPVARGARARRAARGHVSTSTATSRRRWPNTRTSSSATRPTRTSTSAQRGLLAAELLTRTVRGEVRPSRASPSRR